MRDEIYVSVDVEADGPIPGPYSMLSFGMAACGLYDGKRFQALDPRKQTFYRELKPISDVFVPEALAVSGLDRDLLKVEGSNPKEAMEEAAAWLAKITPEGGRPIFAAWPLSFDWLFSYWYFMNFVGSCPFGHSGAIDMKTFYAVRSGLPLRYVGKRGMPAELKSQHPHTHNALDDAIEQGEMFSKLFTWRT